MNKIKQVAARYAFWLRLAAVAALCAAVLAWAGYDLSSRVDGQPVYRIANDEYSQILEIPRGEATGLFQQIEPAAGRTLYGVRLNIATYNYAFSSGRLTVELLKKEADGGRPVAAQGGTDCITLKDNTFADVIFAAPYTPAEGETLLLHISYTAPEDDPACPLGLWASEGERDAMPLLDAAQQPLGATAALQYVVNYSGTWSKTLGRPVHLLLFAAVVLGYALLFGRKAARRVEGAYLAAALALGLAFAIVTPPLVAPDEYSHLAKGYQYACELTGGVHATEDFHLMVRPCDAPYFKTETGDIGIFAYKEMAEHLADAGNPAAFTAPSGAGLATGRGVYAPYLVQGWGIALAFRLGLGFHGMLLLARVCNLLQYLLLSTAAVWWAPKRLKGLFACVGLLPMALQMAASLSPDAAVLGYSFLLTALCLALRQRPAKHYELVLLAAVAAWLAPLKAIYLPVAGLVLLIPAEHLLPRPAAQSTARRTPHPGLLFKLGCLALAGALWCAQNLSAVIYITRDVDNVGLTRAFVALATAAALLGLVYYKIRRNLRAKKIFAAVLAVCVCAAAPVGIYKITHMWGGLTPEDLVGSIQPNGDSIYTYSIGYICRNVPSTVKLLLRSVGEQGAAWLQGVLGTALGEPIVYPIEVSWLLGVGLVLALVAAALRTAGEPPRLAKPSARWGVGLVLLCVVGLTVVAALTWTPINYTAIFGLQGRYWLPVLPLALLLTGEQQAVKAQKDLTAAAVFAVAALTSFVILQGCGLYAAWQMP